MIIGYFDPLPPLSAFHKTFQHCFSVKFGNPFAWTSYVHGPKDVANPSSVSERETERGGRLRRGGVEKRVSPHPSIHPSRLLARIASGDHDHDHARLGNDQLSSHLLSPISLAERDTSRGARKYSQWVVAELLRDCLQKRLITYRVTYFVGNNFLLT